MNHTDSFDALVAVTDAALVVVTTAAGGERAGCLVGFHGQAGIEPPFYSVWLSKANHTYRVSLEAEFLAVHFLTIDDHAWAERFGTTSGEDHDKFAGLDIVDGPGGIPLLAGLPHRIVARRVALLDVGADHVCVALAVESTHGTGGFSPLRLSAESALSPGHEAAERAVPPQG